MFNEFINKYEEKTSFLVVVTLLAIFFFTVTFLLNRAISLEGGHWFWSAFLRFFFTLIFLTIGLIFFKGFSYIRKIFIEFIDKFIFWTISGTLGFGVFYGLICFAADFSPAWIVATTWQITIIASLFVLSFFGKKLPKKIWIYTILVFMGITLVNLSLVDINDLSALVLGFFPVLIAAFAYPIGNQMVWEEKKRRIDGNQDLSVISNAFSKVYLMTLGSFPLWIILYFFTTPEMFTLNQVINVSIISLSSGVIGSSLFLYARSKASTPSKLMLVDACASGEVIFALIGEIMFLGAVFPNYIGVIGIVVTIVSIIQISKVK